LLKTIEEPAPKTIFIFISNKKEKLLPTIKSRLQEKIFSKISNDILLKIIKINNPNLSDVLITKTILENNNNYFEIITSLEDSSNQDLIINDLVEWIRLCFLSKNKNSKYQDNSVVVKLVEWSNAVSKMDKTYQIKFMQTAARFFRSAFLLNYNHNTKEDVKIEHPDFNMENFANYINNSNISAILTLLSKTHYYLSQYGNSKIIFLDLSFTLGKLLHFK